MSSFAALMALSASQTQAAQTDLEARLQQRRLNEAARRKLQEEREQKDRELEQQMRLQHFANEQRKKEEKRRQEREAAQREEVLRRRQEEEREKLRYGPKRAQARATAAASTMSSSSSTHDSTPTRDSHPKYPSSHHRHDNTTTTTTTIRRRGSPDTDAGPALTREEKRERKAQAELKRLSRTTVITHTSKSNTKRRSHGNNSQIVRRLPGGALDLTHSPGSESLLPPSQLEGLSVRARIAAMPNTLTRLNVVKRDMRTIDEIVRDMEMAKQNKVLGIEESGHFDHLFGSKKRESASNSASFFSFFWFSDCVCSWDVHICRD
jgi:protein SPT2